MKTLRHLGLVVLVASPLAAQTPPPPTTPTTPPKIRFQGEFGSEGELYNMEGRDPRRPGESGRVWFNPTFASGPFTVTGNFLLSNESSSLIGLGGLPGRQRINQFGLTPRWSWGKAYLGSFNETWSPLTWGGVRVDGAGFDVTPGALRLGLFAGSSRQAVFGGATSGSYARSIAGARFGVGRKAEFDVANRFIDVMVLRVRDDASSLPPLPDSISVPYLPDSLATAPDTALMPHVPINPYSVTPQENAVVSTSAGLNLFGGAVSWTGELAGSLHSRDQRASELSDDELGDFPRFLRSIVTPRLGTHADVAYRTALDFRVARLPGATTASPRALNLTVAYQSIGAGYVSLGTPYLPNDLEGLDVRASLRFRHWSLQLDGLRQHDNLLGQKLATTDRSRYGASVTLQPARGWTTGIRASTVGMVRDIADSLGGVDYAAHMFNASQSWTPARGSRLRSISASYTWQNTGDDNESRAATSLLSHTADLRVGFALGTWAGLTPSLGVTSARVAGDSSSVRATYGLSADWRDSKRRWTSSASVNNSQVGRTMALSSRLSFRLNVTATDALTLTMRTNRYRSLVDATKDFDERALNLRWARRF